MLINTQIRQAYCKIKHNFKKSGFCLICSLFAQQFLVSHPQPSPMEISLAPAEKIFAMEWWWPIAVILETGGSCFNLWASPPSTAPAMTVKSASGVALPHSASYLINAHRQLSKMQSWCLPTEAYFLYMTLWSFVVSLALSWKDPPGCSARPWTSGSQSYQDARGVSVTEVGELLWWREVLEDREISAGSGEGMCDEQIG